MSRPDNGKERLDAYRPVRVLGQGAHGRAVLVMCRTDNSPRVLKCVNLAKLTTAHAHKAQNEALLLSRVSHPSIVRHYESFMVGHRLCIVTEFAEEGDLRQLVRTRKTAAQPFSDVEIFHVFFQLCEALEYLHAQRIVHRDIKGDNVFVKEGLTVRLGDFGVSRELATDDAKAETSVGTPYYLSPEQCRRQPYDSKSDMWALGCLLYELITFEHPFVANSFTGLCAAIIVGQYRPITRPCHAFLPVLVQRLLQHATTDRPTASQILEWRARIFAPTMVTMAPPQDGRDAIDPSQAGLSTSHATLRAKLMALFKLITATITSGARRRASTDDAEWTRQVQRWLWLMQIQLERALGLSTFGNLNRLIASGMLSDENLVSLVALGFSMHDLRTFYVPLTQQLRQWQTQYVSHDGISLEFTDEAMSLL